MKALTRWDPFAEVPHVRRLMDRIFDDTLFRPYRLGVWTQEEGHIRLDIYQTKDEVVAKASLPGVKPEEMEISIDHNTLTIRGEVKGSEDVDQDSYVLRERRRGTFQRSVTLPNNLKTDKTVADFEDGILTISIPKADEAKTKTIKVNPVHRTESKKA